MEQQRRPRKRKRTMIYRIGTWNVRTLQRPHAFEDLLATAEEYRMELIALQEIRWSGTGIHQTPKYSLFYSGHPTEKTFGTGFLVREKLTSAVMNFKPINERLCMIRIRGKFSNITLINVHSPTEEKPADEKELFYGELERLLSSVPQHDVRIVLGDFNAQIGKERIFSKIVGPDGKHELSNDNGMRVANFAMANGLVVASTYFPHKMIHKETWISPSGNARNQIDHVLIGARHFSSISDCRTFRGADIGSDHLMVCTSFRERISWIFCGKTQHMRRFNIETLKNDSARETYKRLVKENIEVANSNPTDCNSQWIKLKSSILDAAEKVISEKPLQRKNPWFDDEC